MFCGAGITVVVVIGGDNGRDGWLFCPSLPPLLLLPSLSLLSLPSLLLLLLSLLLLSLPSLLLSVLANTEPGLTFSEYGIKGDRSVNTTNIKIVVVVLFFI